MLIITSRVGANEIETPANMTIAMDKKANLLSVISLFFLRIVLCSTFKTAFGIYS